MKLATFYVEPTFKITKENLMGIALFYFPKAETEIEHRCNLIERQDGKDGFKVTQFT